MTVLEQEKTNRLIADSSLIENINKILESKKIDQTTLAKRIGYSSSAVSTYLKGNYNGNLLNIEAALRKFLKGFKANEKRVKTVLNFVDTSVSKNVHNIASLCQYNGEIGVCIGSSGIGKTTAIKEYKRTQVGVITVDPDENTSPRAVLKQIACQLKIPESQYMEAFIEDVVKRLYGSNSLIIIDEAENLNSKMFRMLRKIHDRCDGTIGILFVGTEVLYANLLKLRGEYNYVVNRIGCCAKLDELNEADVRALVYQIYPDISDSLLSVFFHITNRNARVLYNTLKRTKDIINNSGTELNKEIIETARNYLLVTKMGGI